MTVDGVAGVTYDNFVISSLRSRLVHPRPPRQRSHIITTPVLVTKSVAMNIPCNLWPMC
jgi:hypothetical protein